MLPVPSRAAYPFAGLLRAVLGRVYAYLPLAVAVSAMSVLGLLFWVILALVYLLGWWTHRHLR